MNLDSLVNQILLESEFLTEADLMNMFGKLISKAAEKLGRDPNTTLEIVLQADPTNRKYVEWILKQYLEDKIVLPEDAQRVARAIGAFERIKKRTNLQFEKDIRKHDINSLEDVVEQFGKKKSQRELKKEFKEEGTRVVAKTDDFLIIEILSGEYAPKYAVGTRWCTSNSGTAQNYINNNHGLYLIFQQKDEKWVAFIQFTGDFGQFMNIQDRPVKYDDLPGKLKKLLTPSNHTDPKIMAGFSNWRDRRLPPELEQQVFDNDGALVIYKWRHDIPGYIERIMSTNGKAVHNEYLVSSYYNRQKSKVSQKHRMALLNNTDKPAVAGAFILMAVARLSSGRNLHSTRNDAELERVFAIIESRFNAARLLETALQDKTIVGYICPLLQPNTLSGDIEYGSVFLHDLRDELVKLFSDPKMFAKLTIIHPIINQADGNVYRYPESMVKTLIDHDYAWKSTIEGIILRFLKYPTTLKAPELKKLIAAINDTAKGTLAAKMMSNGSTEAREILWNFALKWGKVGFITIWGIILNKDVVSLTKDVKFALLVSLIRGVPTNSEKEMVLDHLDYLAENSSILLSHWIGKYKRDWNQRKLGEYETDYDLTSAMRGWNTYKKYANT